MKEKGHEPTNRNSNKIRGVQVKQNRNYKYSEDEIRWVRQASTEDICKRYNLDRVRAANLRWGMRSGFKWCK
jgi:hypothetical protein